MDEEKPPDVVIIDRDRPSPFETMFLFVAALGGGAILVLGSQVSSALTTALPGFVTVLFAGGLVVGGATALFGRLAMKSLDGELVESTGLVLVACLMSAYACFALAYAGLHGFIQALFLVALAAASVWRIVQSRLHIRNLREGIRSAAAELRRKDGD